MKLFLYKKSLVLILVGCILWDFTTVVPSMASEPVQTQNFFQRIWRRFTDRPKRDERPATVGRGGANRDRCPYTKQELVALVPVSSNTGLPYLERTLAAYPTWYFYVPYQPRLGRQIEFVLLDIDENILYQQIFTLSNTPGILRISLPDHISGLKINQAYRWVFSIVCNPSNRSGDATVNGWIERVESTALIPNFETVDIRKRYLLYANSLFWFDAINELVSLRETYPKDPELEAAWNSLLKTLNLRGLPNTLSSVEEKKKPYFHSP